MPTLACCGVSTRTTASCCGECGLRTSRGSTMPVLIGPDLHAYSGRRPSHLLGMLGDVLCLSADGMADGNHGPFTDEAHYFADGRKRVKSDVAADGSRTLRVHARRCRDARAAGRRHPLEVRHAARGQLLALTTPSMRRSWSEATACTSATTSVLSGATRMAPRGMIDARKKKYDKARYDSPSLIVLDKNTGQAPGQDYGGHLRSDLPRGPLLADIGKGQRQGTAHLRRRQRHVLRVDPDSPPAPTARAAQLKLVWKFNCLDPATLRPGLQVVAGQRPRRSPPRCSTRTGSTPHRQRPGRSGSRGAGRARLVCIDATKTGDITDSGRIWSFDDMRSTASTVAISGGLLYTADASGVVYCLDAETGRLYWTHQTAPCGVLAPGGGRQGVRRHARSGLLVFAQGKERRC